MSDGGVSLWFGIAVIAMSVLVLVGLFERARRRVEDAKKQDRLRAGWSLEKWRGG